MKKAMITFVVLALIAVVIATVGPRLLNRSVREAEPASLSQASEHQGQTFVTVRGAVVPAQWAQLGFALNGQLAEIKVAVGVTVTAGQALAVQDSRELELDVQLAQSDLAAEEANLAQLKTGPTQAELDAAQASYDAAVASYEQLRAGPSAQERNIAQADFKVAERTVQQAQAAYDSVRNRPDIGARPEALQLERATIDFQRAKATYELAIAPPDEAALRAAMSQVAAAKYQLERTRAGVESSAVQSAEAAVARAKAALSRAQLTLQQAVLKAPFDGVVTSVTETRPGGMVGAGETILTIADLSQLQIEVQDLDEWGAANVTRDQNVDLVVPALNNLTPRGRLVFISQEPTVSASGAVFYGAIVSLEKQEPSLRWGMTARAKLFLPGAQSAGFR